MSHARDMAYRPSYPLIRGYLNHPKFQETETSNSKRSIRVATVAELLLAAGAIMANVLMLFPLASFMDRFRRWEIAAISSEECKPSVFGRLGALSRIVRHDVDSYDRTT